MFLFETKNSQRFQYAIFFSSFLDVTIISAFIWTFYSSDLSAQWIHTTFFPSFFIVVGFTAFHNNGLLSICTGLYAVCIYCYLSVVLFPSTDTGAMKLLISYTPGLVMLFITSLLSALVSRNNLKLVSKAIDSEGRIRKLGKTFPLMLFKLDRRGRFLWANTTANARFGLNNEDLIGKNIHDFIAKSENFEFSGLPMQGTYKVKKFIDDIKYVDCVIVQGEDKDGAFEGSMVDVSDRELAITQREEMEQRLFQYKKTESLGTLARGMAHDFNHILQTIIDITDRVAKNTGEAKTKKEMSSVSDISQDAGFLISELHDLGRKKPLDYHPMDMVKFLKRNVPAYSDQIGDSFEVSLNTKDSEAWIFGDKNYLKRVFQNLFINARDAMPGGGIINVECFMNLNDGGDASVIIRFSDTGIGIPKNIIEKIFDPFYSTKKKDKGTGLGLAIVRRIVSLHKGIVTIEKTDSHGTVFRIEIPECSEHFVDIDTKALLVNRISTGVLLLDDDPKMCKILNFFLSELLYKSFESSTVEDGLRILQDNIKDCKVLIMDWKLGEENPHEVIRKFRELLPELIIIVVSGYQPIQKSIEKMNISRWITKPYDKNRLDLEIQRALYIQNKPK